MTKTLRCAVAGAITALCLLPAGASAAPRDLWATVNICDTKKNPDMLGIRARMPGTAKRERMYMRFTAQFRKKGRWRAVDNGRSRWIKAGSAQNEFQERGFTFPIRAGEGASFLLRGYVEFQWRKGGRVTKRLTRVTTGGHPTRSADPRGFTAARCRIEA